MKKMPYKREEPFVSKLRHTLEKTDSIALDNVTHDSHGHSILGVTGNPLSGMFPRGGPFGAVVALSDEDENFEIIGDFRANNVVNSGIASYHAEDQVLKSDNFTLLVNRLKTVVDSGRTPTVWMISSSQSCTTCHAKQEIAARHLINMNLIKPGYFITLYGATYDDTLDIAQFYDAQYADALIFCAHNPTNCNNLIRHSFITFENAPAEVRALFEQAMTPTAAVVRDNSVYAIGQDKRNSLELYTTAEVDAIRSACLRRRTEGAFASWEIDGTLYTTTPEIGPLLFAEAGWTKILNIVTVTMPPDMKSKQFSCQEAIGISNNEFLHIMADGYQSQKSAIRVFHDRHFINRAQPMWARVLNANKQVLYNGASVSEDILKMRDMHTRFKFSAYPIEAYQGSLRNVDIHPRLLKRIGS